MRGVIAGIVAGAMLGLAGQAMAGSCWSRTYSAEHLLANPMQTVRVLSVRFGDGADRTAHVKVHFRDTSETYRETLYCWDPDPAQYGDAFLGCSVECDGGHFVARRRGVDAILIETPGGFLVSGGCGDEGDMRRVTDRDAAKTVFKLYETADSFCD